MIEAAGGVMLRTTDDSRVDVLVVHRARRADWSLPKGKLDPGERAEDAAVREVEEETGVTGRLGAELPSVRYEVEGVPKRVRWFLMEHVAGDPDQRPADEEVDVATWWPADEAAVQLTYQHDRELLAAALDAVAR